MDFHLDRKLKYISEPQHKGLYSWGIAEVDEAGEQVGPDMIPWGWSLNFTATRISLGNSLRISPVNLRDKAGESTVTDSRSIHAVLKPGFKRDEKVFGATSYFMFGTDRPVEEFALEIAPFEGEISKEECSAWGTVSYTSEIDFRYQKHPDYLSFYLLMKPETFVRYAALIAQRAVSEAVLRVGSVEGFYSEWSPGISTTKVKILTHGKEQEVQVPEGADNVPLRLGKVAEAQFSMNCHMDLETEGDFP
ncbi:hypothetical protein GCM10007989_13470 [Devosia pacifica]|uniref:Uncharacterized protein n=1 Tax=Devosia pacifica TaxID=1335967 RepID=A0A918VSQ1_9HYPH|nr:hypothetical protein [Devosia pacifica]GHA19274.1 hypothetical protein GCM10007989_13470 [Devosia pacifica]